MLHCVLFDSLAYSFHIIQNTKTISTTHISEKLSLPEIQDTRINS